MIDSKIKKILRLLFIFVILSIVIFYCTTLEVKAYSLFPTDAYLYDNRGTSGILQQTVFGGFDSNNQYITSENSFTLTAGSNGALLTFNTDQTLVPGRIYNMVVNVDIPEDNAKAVLSSKPSLGAGYSYTNSNQCYFQNWGYVNILSSQAEGSRLYYTFTVSNALQNYYYLSVPFTSSRTVTTTPYIRGVSIIDMGSTDQLNQNSIEDIINANNSAIQNDLANISQSIFAYNEDLKNSINESLKTCRPGKNLYNKDIPPEQGYLSGNIYLTSSIVRSIFLEIKPNTTYTISKGFTSSRFSAATFDHKPLNNSTHTGNVVNNSGTSITITTKANDKYLVVFYWRSGANYDANVSEESIRNTIQIEEGSTRTSYEPYGQVCKNKIDDVKDTISDTNDKIDQTNDKLNNLNDSLNNSNSTGATSEAGNFFSGFETDTHGLTGIIVAPLNLISSITNSSCSPLGLQIPFVNNQTLNLPCLRTIYENYFGSFLTIYQTVTFGIVAYWVCVNIFRMVKDFKNPDHDEIEVLDL